MIRMYEIFSVPSNAADDVAIYQRIFEDLFNLTNITDVQSNASAVTNAAFELRKSAIYGEIQTSRRHRRLALEPTYIIDGVEYGLDELENLYRSVDCGAEQYLVQVSIEAIVRDPSARLLFFKVAYGYALADQLRNFDIVPCDTATFENIQLDVIPAPSPPPPNDWVIPPSPPVFAYEVYTTSMGMSTTVGFFLIACLCCALCGKGFDRDRGTSRMVGVGRLRVDGSGWGPEGRGKRSHQSGLFGPDYHSKTRNHELAVGLAAADEEPVAGLSWSWMSGGSGGAEPPSAESQPRRLERRSRRSKGVRHGFVRVDV